MAALMVVWVVSVTRAISVHMFAIRARTIVGMGMIKVVMWMPMSTPIPARRFISVFASAAVGRQRYIMRQYGLSARLKIANGRLSAIATSTMSAH
jgi:hypothetical protein